MKIATELRIGICKNENNWHVRFYEAFKTTCHECVNIFVEMVNIDTDDWIETVEKYDVIIWKPNHMGIESASYFKEKIYFIEKYLGKMVIPNFSTVWHFESKVAQKYIFEKLKVSTPRTVATFSYTDAMNRLKEFQFPIVIKKSAGAASRNVILLSSCSKAKAAIKRIFCKQVVDIEIERKGPLLGRLTIHYCRRYQGWRKGAPNQPVVYWQEFIPSNDRDLRITVIGNKYAFGFWRRNRPNDFRASGSGMIDYDTPVPAEAIQYCMHVSSVLDFDSMAYDILLEKGRFKIIEMSFGYVDTAIHNSKGYYEHVDKELKYHAGHYWPQEIWTRWCIDRIEKRFLRRICG